MIVGFETRDDAGVYRISKDRALVQTVDFFTPIVDDPFQFGQISAANSLSDIYAMGGVPISSLTIVGFPRAGQDFSILESILSGGMSKMMEAHCTVVGGHSIGDEEIKFGYAVTGVIDPAKVIRNVGAQVGDVLILTKPLGTGVISTALKQDAVDDSVIQSSIRWMIQLNRDASEIAQARGVDAMTDITGFGLLGHAREMARGSHVTLEFHQAKIPVIEGALDCIKRKMIPGGLVNNKRYLEPQVEFSDSVPESTRMLLYDPQTSGGLMMACSPKVSEQILTDMRSRGIPAVGIGKVCESGRVPLRVV